ncbi:hypothetical protein UZ36_05785 [Candidatus Nitromaritima sp. SCGC AAA799-C22]|nr:hypothetical protein UZ36_05785 [Candidatus Nitromaritima sp. SCGC AAA799-C22]
MQPALFPQISSSPSLIWLLPAIGFHILNLAVGAFMAFRKKSPGVLKIHRFLFYGILICLFNFLVINQVHGENTVWDYLVFLYFIIVIPTSKRWDDLIHAFIALIGLVLLPLLIVLQM